MYQRRTAAIYVTMERLAALLTLPEGVRPVGLHAELDPPGVNLVVECDQFPPVEEGCYSPRLCVEQVADVITYEGVKYRHLRPGRTAAEIAASLREGNSKASD